MEGIYPLSSPIILTDSVFVAYGGHTGNSTAAQRTAAYLIAEIATTYDLETFLLPLIYTGTYLYNSSIHKQGLLLEFRDIHRVYKTSFIDFDESVYWTQVGTGNDFVAIRDDTFGILDIDYLLSNCKCVNSSHPSPYKVQVVFQAGLPTGTANRPDILMAMVTYADVMLQELIGYGNEAPGDIGVQQYTNQEYQERRIGLIRTVFGSSPRANMAHRLLDQIRVYRWCGL